MAKRYIAILLIILLLSISLAGCYDNRGVEELAYPVAIAIDQAQDNMIYITLQFPNSPSSGDSKDSQTSTTSITTIECFDINSGLSLINSYLGKQVDLSHCKILAFSETLAIKGLDKYFYTLANIVEVRPDCNVIITRCDAKDYLALVDQIIETPTSRYYELFIGSGKYTGFTTSVGVASFYSGIISTRHQAFAILGGINQSTNNSNNNKYISEDNSYKAGEVPSGNNSVIEDMGLAVFFQDRLVGELNSIETMCHLLVINKFNSAIITIPSPLDMNEDIDLYVSSRKNTKNSVEMVNDSPYISTNVYLNCFGMSASSTIDYSNEENLKLIEDFAKSYLETQISGYLYKISKEFNSDIVGFGRYVVSNYWTIQEWDNKNWLSNFKNSFFDVNVDISIKSGNLLTKM